MAFVLGMLVPGLLFGVSEKLINRQVPLSNTTAETTAPTEVSNLQKPAQGGILVQMPDGTQSQMDMQAYLTGVLLAEMPVDFAQEALKAQAVVSRTYALRTNTVGKKHDGGAVCTEAACCQAYRSSDDFLANGGTQDLLAKVTAAVQSTQNEILTYNGALIEATYFSCSGGRTEDALAVWGSDIPYLQAVDSPGEESATHFVDAVQFTTDEFTSLLGFKPDGPSSRWFGAVTYTDGGGVSTINIGGKIFTGTEVRKKLGLRSTVFTMLAVGDHIHISTRGFGHRVGMSQYGAEAMAVGGSSYREILAHYYPGTALSTQN